MALRCAARNRATFCSGVSRKGGDPALLPRPAGPGPAAEAEEGAGEEVGELKRAGGVAALEFACRVLAVKRVASETLRGAAQRRRVGFILRRSRRGRQGGALADAEGREGGRWVQWLQWVQWVQWEASELESPSKKQPLMI